MAVVTLPIDKIIQSDALTALKELPSDWIDCCVTSPPYWALRDYQVSGQLGSEPTFHRYLDNLIKIFAEVKRVIKPTGSIWVNIGDTYDSNKSLCGVPERFAIKMQEELRLIRRNTIIWYKGNAMPSSAKDRFTIDFEYIYFFTKSPRYFFETQYEPLILEDNKVNNAKKLGWDGKQDYKDWYFNTRKKKSWHDHRADKEKGFGQQTRGQKPLIIHFPLGRQKRTVWKVSTRPFAGAHFAVYPPQLIEPILKAVCPSQICIKCEVPRKLEYEKTQLIPSNSKQGFDTDCKSRTDDDPHKDFHSSAWSRGKPQVIRMPKFGGNKYPGKEGGGTYSGKEWNPITRRLKQALAKEMFPEDPDILSDRLKSMGADINGEYTGTATKDYESAKAQNASDTKRRILESYKKRATSEYVMTDCGCNAGFRPGICIDPFFGSGTTGVVALQQNKSFVGIELNPSYIEIAMKRLQPLLQQTKLF